MYQTFHHTQSSPSCFNEAHIEGLIHHFRSHLSSPRLSKSYHIASVSFSPYFQHYLSSMIKNPDTCPTIINLVASYKHSFPSHPGVTHRGHLGSGWSSKAGSKRIVTSTSDTPFTQSTWNQEKELLRMRKKARPTLNFKL